MATTAAGSTAAAAAAAAAAAGAPLQWQQQEQQQGRRRRQQRQQAHCHDRCHLAPPLPPQRRRPLLLTPLLLLLLTLLLAPARPAAAVRMPTFGLGKVDILQNLAALKWSRLTVTPMRQLPGRCGVALDAAGRLTPPPTEPAAACGPQLADAGWLRAPENDTRGAALMMALSRDAYPKVFNLTQGPDWQCAFVRKAAALGATNVTFLDSYLFNAAVVVAPPNVFLVIRGTDGRKQEESNG